MLAELRVTPIDAHVPFVRVVADLLPVLADSPLEYQVHAMGTTLEGRLDDILAVVRRCHDELRKHAERVLIELSIDDRAGAHEDLCRGLEHLRSYSDQPLERIDR
jgi:uncharacterized protein (TIGR00106 family)